MYDWRRTLNRVTTSQGLFHSARLKLTAFYFAVLVVFCVLLTFGLRAFTVHELSRGDDAQRGTVRQLLQGNPPQNYGGDGLATPFGARYFNNVQQNQADETRQHLNRDYFLIDIVLLALGAVLSYWYAGRTLKPIEEAHEQQKRFTSDASHELRTPLASMKLENEVFLRQKSFTEAAARELIESNLEEVERLEKLAGNLLALNHYEHDLLTHEPVAVSELVEAAISQVTKHKTAKKVQFDVMVSPAAVDVNRESIIELLGIVLDNAVKYGPAKGTVDIMGELSDQTYTLTIRDRGPGISDEDLPHIFERMYRGDKARSSKVAGHGIGLSLARQIAEANEATLTAGNAPGGGAVFTLTFS